MPIWDGSMLLDIKNIDVLYDDFQVIWDLSLSVKTGEMVALLGPNGSGKSTILNTISNLIDHKTGDIYFDRERISDRPTFQRTAMGISHVLERRRVFPHLTVLQTCFSAPGINKPNNPASNPCQRFTGCSPSWQLARINWRIPCPGASSKCWRSRAA